jgi:orotate phosphoribosyltransferase-like protein
VARDLKFFKNIKFAAILIFALTLAFLLVSVPKSYAAGTDKATSDYNAALKTFNAAVAKLSAAERRTPRFYIYGEITHRYKNELWIWGYATSSTASPSHPGWLLQPGNIIIKNYDSRNIVYNNYFGYNYYINQTTGIGLFGQRVPVNNYGPTPSTIIQLQKAVDQAARNLRDKKLKLPAEFSIKYNGKIVTDNGKHPMKLDEVPFSISLSNQSKGAESSEWYISTGKNKWKLLSKSQSTTTLLTSENATIKLVINHNKNNYKIHNVYVSLPATGFKDIPKAHWAAHSIIKVTNSGLMKDYKDGKFHPTTTVTRGQLAKLIVQAYKLKTIQPAVPTFTDVPKSNPYYSYIETAKYYFSGSFVFSDSAKFNPNSTISKDETTNVFTRLTLLDRQSFVTRIQGYNSQMLKGSSPLDRASTAYLLNKTTEKYYSGYRDNAKFTTAIPDLTYYNQLQVSMNLTGNAKVFLNNQLASFDYNNEYLHTFNLSNGEGSYLFNIKIVKPFKIEEINKTVLYEIPVPSLTVNFVPTSTDQESITISGAVSDKADQDLQLYVNDKEVYVSYNGNWSKDFDLTEGNNTFVIKAVNSHGKSTTVTKVVTFTPPAPVLTVISPASTTELDSITISGTVTDKNDEYPKVYVNDKEVYVDYYGNWSENFSLTEGKNTFVIKAVNSKGKSSSDTKVVTFTPPAPVLTVVSPASTTELDSITISGTVTDKNDEYPKVYVNDKEVYVDYYGNWSGNFSLTEGNNTFVIKAVNSHGKSTTVTKVVTFTPPAPVLTVVSPASTTELDSITISGTVTDKNDEYPKVYVNDKEVYVDYYGNWSENFSLNKGANTFTIKATNSFGKVTTVTRTITLN